MEKKHWIIIGFAAALLIAIVVLVVIQFESNQTTFAPANSKTNTLTPTNSVSEYLGPRIPIKTTNNSTVNVADFNKESYVDTSTVTVLYADSRFSIQYDKINSEFGITLTGAGDEDLNKVRSDAEQKFLDKLAISEIEACKLKVDEVIPSTEGSPKLTQYQFGLSFCP